MSPPIPNGDVGDDEEEGLPDGDDGFDEDMEALRQACMLTGVNFDSLGKKNFSSSSLSLSSAADAATTYAYVGGASDSDSEEDLEILRNIQNRFALSADLCEPLSLKPLCSLPPVSDDEDDFETLSAIRRRFAAYDINGNSKETADNFGKQAEQFHAWTPGVENKSFEGSLVVENNSSEASPSSEEAADITNLPNDTRDLQPSHSIALHQSDACQISTWEQKYSSFPKSAQVFIDAIRRNRSCQKFLRAKINQIEARIEENKKVKKRVLIMKNFQACCRRKAGWELSQRKDPRIQLISPRTISNYEVKNKMVSRICDGPVENFHVANYRMALANFPPKLKRKKWTEAEKENLLKGIRQQFQEMVLQFSVDRLSDSEGFFGDANNLDSMLASIRDLEITPEKIREFLPKVDWGQLASLYAKDHSGAECAARWLNFEDPLINNTKWTAEEEKILLSIVQGKGITKWFDIAVSLGTNRTPFSCLERFQRSLNAHIIKKEWTEDEDALLRAAVETFGYDWQSVASCLELRTGTQCSNRWRKSLDPNRQRKGRWTTYEDKCLRVAVEFFGPKNWNKIAKFVPGRTQERCRERWVNTLDPSLGLGKWMGKWTEEEDSRLKAAVEECGYSWAKVAQHLTGRTDNCCSRRWKVLFPDEAPLLQIASRTKRAAMIGNFVDRESERPALGPSDFVPVPVMGSVPRKRKRKSRDIKFGKETDATPAKALKKRKPKSKQVQTSSEETSGLTDGIEFEASCGESTVKPRRTIKRSSRKKSVTETMTITSGNVRVSRTRQKLPDLQAKKNNYNVETDCNSQKLLMLPTESLDSGTTTPDGFQNSGGSNRKNGRKSCKKRSVKKTCAKFSKEHCNLSGTIYDDNESVHGDLDSSLLMTTTGQGKSIIDQLDAFSKRTVEQGSNREVSVELAESMDCCLSPAERPELQVTITSIVEKLHGVEVASNKESKPLQHYYRRKRK